MCLNNCTGIETKISQFAVIPVQLNFAVIVEACTTDQSASNPNSCIFMSEIRRFTAYAYACTFQGIGDWPNLTSHRRAFRPVDQMTVGQTIVFVGFIEITLIDYLSGHDESAPHAWTMIWSGALVSLLCQLLLQFVDVVNVGYSGQIRAAGGAM